MSLSTVWMLVNSHPLPVSNSDGAEGSATRALSSETLTVVGSEAGRCSTLGRAAGCVFFFLNKLNM